MHLRRDPRRSRTCSVPTRNSRSSRAPARSRHKGEVKRCRSQPQTKPLLKREGRQFRISGSSHSSHRRVRASVNSRCQGQARRMRRPAREHRRSKGRGRVRVRREAAPKMRNEVRVASKVRGTIDTQPPRRFSAHKLNADSTAPIPQFPPPIAWRRAGVPPPCRPETAPASECCGC